MMFVLTPVRQFLPEIKSLMGVRSVMGVGVAGQKRQAVLGIALLDEGDGVVGRKAHRLVELGQSGFNLLQQQQNLSALVVHVRVFRIQAFRLLEVGQTLFALIELYVKSGSLYVGVCT